MIKKYNLDKNKFKMWFCVIIFLFFYLILMYQFVWENTTQDYVVYSSPLENSLILESDYQQQINYIKEADNIEIPLLFYSTNEADFITIKVEYEGNIYSNNVYPNVNNDDFKLVKALVTNDYLLDDIYEYILIKLGKGTGNFECVISIVTNDLEDDAWISIGGYSAATGEIKLGYRLIVDSNITKIMTAIIGGSFCILFIFIYIILSRLEMPIEKVFIVFSIIIGLYFFALFPSGNTNDVTYHIAAVYHQTNIFFGQNTLDTDNTTAMFESDKFIYENIIYDSEQLFYAPNTKAYSEQIKYLNYHADSELLLNSWWHIDINLTNFVEYLPYVIGYILGRLVNMSFLQTLIFSRILGFAFFLMMYYKAIKIIPYGKEALIALGLNPIVIQTATSITYDNMTVAASVLSFSFIFFLREEIGKRDLNKRDFMISFILIILLGSCKSGIYLLSVYGCAFLFLFIEKNFIRNRKYLLSASLLSLMVLAVLFMFNMYIYKKKLSGDVLTSTNYSALNIFTHPIDSLLLYFRTLFNYLDNFFIGINGGLLGWSEFMIPTWLVTLNMLFFVYATLRQKEEQFNLSNRDIIMLILSLLVAALFVFTTFLSATGIEEKYIYGIQGRYFIPFIPIIIPIIKKLPIYRRKIKSNHMIYFWGLSGLNLLYILSICMTR